MKVSERSREEIQEVAGSLATASMFTLAVIVLVCIFTITQKSKKNCFFFFFDLVNILTGLGRVESHLALVRSFMLDASCSQLCPPYLQRGICSFCSGKQQKFCPIIFLILPPSCQRLLRALRLMDV